MTFCTVTVLAIIVQLALLCCFPQVRAYIGLTKRSTHEESSLDFELFRIEQAKQLAMDDIRRRRQYTEDQINRLARWSK